MSSLTTLHLSTEQFFRKYQATYPRTKKITKSKKTALYYFEILEKKDKISSNFINPEERIILTMSKKIIQIIALAFLMAGCSVKQEKINLDSVDFSRASKQDMSTFEVNLLRISAKAEQHWKDYYARLEKHKNLYDEKLKLHVPQNMGKIIDIDFDGRIGDLLSQLAYSVGYEIIFRDININSTPVTTVKYHKTSVWDIIQMTMAKVNDYGLDIVENDRTITIYPKY